MDDEYIETNCRSNVIKVDSRFFMVTAYYVISVITLETRNTQDAHRPHRSSEKTVLKNMRTGQYVFTIS